MDSSDYFVALKLVSGSVEAVAKKEAMFVQQDDKRFTNTGPGVPAAVERFYGNGRRRMRATQVCDISAPESGFHAGVGECFWAVMSDGKRAVVVDTQGILGNDAHTPHSVDSLRFMP